MKLFVPQSEGEGCGSSIYGVFDAYDKALAAKPKKFHHRCVGRAEGLWTDHRARVDKEGNSEIDYSEIFSIEEVELNVPIYEDL